MKIFYLLLFTSIISSTQAQDFYNMDVVQNIEVTFNESNWDQLLDNAKASDDGYILAQSVTINGTTFDSVGVKYKGNSTYSPNQIKNPWHIELDTYKDHEYDGYTDIKLANASKDPSFLRDVLGYQIARQYMDAPLANFANLYVNGTLIGLYSNTESISKKFMNKRFGSKENTRFKCSPPDGAGPQTRDFPNLVYLGQDSTAYYDSYELKSDNGWQELIDLCDTLANHTEDIDQMLDVDRALWMLAFDNVIVNLDSYIGQFAQNYYLYRSDEGQFIPIVWDLNESFGTFSRTGTIDLNNTAVKQQMTPLLHENDNEYPLVQKLLSIPMYKRMYLAHIKTMLLENIDNGAYFDVGLSLQNTIKSAVLADGNKFFTYDNFISNLTNDIGGGGGPGGGGPGGGGPGNASTPGIATLMNGRAQYLLGLSDFTAIEPAISDISLSKTSPSINETITLTARVSDGTNVFLGYRNAAITAPFERVQMFDDGAHGDGGANDGVYGVELTINSIDTDYYIYAENNTVGMFSPRRAEYEYYNIQAEFSQSVDGVVINEFMASNDATVADQDGEFEDWIELYNNGDEAVNLSGYFLTDDGTDLTQWSIPDGTIIASGGYLTIWADGDTDQEGLHADFKLSGSGESVILVGTDGTTIVDAIDYPEQTTDLSYARIPNGTGDFKIGVSTFSANNDGTIVVLSDVVINEFMASNDTTVTDPDGEFEDWIELYNNGSESIDLSGYFLTDDAADLTQWSMPEGTTIEPDGYLIIWADGDTDQEGLHADFKLSGSGESVILSSPTDTSIVDAVDYPEQSTDLSYARIPNGTGDFKIGASTFSANNDETKDCSAAGGDMDNDGVCADDDCDDTDATVGAIQAEGTICDDGDTTTDSDVILSDGCSCEGTTIELSDVVINEFMASNDATVADLDGEFEDWIELFNNDSESVDLSGFFLTDDAADLTQWSFPEGTSIEAGGYLTVWADDDVDQEGLHANFKLSGGGESIILSNPNDTSIVDAIDYPEQKTDISYGRFPNGTGDFRAMDPTFGQENAMTTSTQSLLLDNDSLRIFPNPTKSQFYLEYNTGAYKEKLVTIYSMTGATVYKNSVVGKTLISTSNWSPGAYVVRSEGAVIKLIVY